MNTDTLHVVSLSGGKDSTAMLLLMMERGWPIDAVLNADTGMEFPEMYEHLRRLDEHPYRERGLHITTLKSSRSFEYLMFDEAEAAAVVHRQPAAPRRSLQGQRLAGHPCALVYGPAQDAPHWAGDQPAEARPRSRAVHRHRRRRGQALQARTGATRWPSGA